jgi:hypothetical protein
MAKEADRMVERVRRLQEIAHCMKNNHDWSADHITALVPWRPDYARMSCNHCGAFFTVARTNGVNAEITPLFIEHEGINVSVEAFLENKEEEE